MGFWVRWPLPTEMREVKATAGGAPLTILHVTAPARVGGLERVVTVLAAGHGTAGHDVHVLAVLTENDPDHPFVNALKAAGVKVHDAVLPPRAYRRERKVIADLCCRLRPSVVHTHGYRSDLLGGSVAKGMGVPTVATVHGFVRGSRKGRMYEWLQRRAYRTFTAVAAVSALQVEEIVAAGVVRDCVHLIPNAWGGSMDLESGAAVRAELGVSSDRFHIGWVGRLSREKGADVMVEALSLLKDLPLVVSMIGDGPERAALEEQARALGVDGAISWRGLLPDASRLFPSFDAFVLSSRTEGTPIALLEAMAAENPIVATRVGGVPDVVGCAEALLLPSEDPGALADAIRSLYSDPEHRRLLALAARKRLDEAYALTPWLARYEALYESLQPNHNPP